MRSFWKLTIAVLFVAAISGAAITWREYKAHISKLKLAEDATKCRERAEQSDAAAQAALADMYYYGRGVQRDYGTALLWYHKAADQGNAKGEDGVGTIYYYGRGVPQDYAEALRWYRKAADQGYADSQYNLGNIYYYGRGVAQNRSEAGRWYQKAADQGDEYAQHALGLRWPLSSWSAITLGAAFLGGLWALKDAVLQQRNSRHHQPRTLTIGGIFGLAYIGLSLYGHFSVFETQLTASVFHFLNTLVAGIAVAMFISVVAPNGAKTVLVISGILLMLIDLPVIWRHELTRFVTTVRGFSSSNGLLIGIAVPLATFLWLQTINKAKDQRAAG